MPLTRDCKETIAKRAMTDPALAKALHEEMARLESDEKETMRDLLESALIQARRGSATQGNTIEIKTGDL